MNRKRANWYKRLIYSNKNCMKFNKVKMCSKIKTHSWKIWMWNCKHRMQNFWIKSKNSKKKKWSHSIIAMLATFLIVGSKLWLQGLPLHIRLMILFRIHLISIIIQIQITIIILFQIIPILMNWEIKF
jgi:hypothetical protein